MDVFMEKIVPKRKDLKDSLIASLIVFFTVVVSLILIVFKIPLLSELGLNIFIVAGLIYLAYRLITSRNVEFEYIVTNGDLDIDRITAKRKRKRIFSASCKEFDILARTSSNRTPTATDHPRPSPRRCSVTAVLGSLLTG